MSDVNVFWTSIVAPSGIGIGRSFGFSGSRRRIFLVTTNGLQFLGRPVFFLDPIVVVNIAVQPLVLEIIIPELLLEPLVGIVRQVNEYVHLLLFKLQVEFDFFGGPR